MRNTQVIYERVILVIMPSLSGTTNEVLYQDLVTFCLHTTVGDLTPIQDIMI